MANFINVLPDDVIKDIQKIYKNSDEIFGSMTQAGARVVEKNIRANAPKGVRNEPKLMNKLKVSRTYKTPSDGGINTKTAFFYGKPSFVYLSLVPYSKAFNTSGIGVFAPVLLLK